MKTFSMLKESWKKMELAIFKQKNYPGLLPGINIKIQFHSCFAATPAEFPASEPP